MFFCSKSLFSLKELKIFVSRDGKNIPSLIFRGFLDHGDHNSHYALLLIHLTKSHKLNAVKQGK